MKLNKNILIALAVIAVLIGVAYYVQNMHQKGYNPNGGNGGGDKKNFSPHLARQEYDLVNDDFVRAPSSNQLMSSANACGGNNKQGEMYGYKYQLPEELPSVESMMPEESACSSVYDPEAAENVPYVFTYPLTAAIVKTRLEQSGDMWRGDLNGEARDPNCDFKTIWNSGDQLLHGAFADYTKKSHEIVGCKNGGTSGDVWSKNAPINVANQELIMDY